MTIFGLTKSKLLGLVSVLLSAQITFAQSGSGVINQGAAGAAASFFAARSRSFVWSGAVSYSRIPDTNYNPSQILRTRGDLDLKIIRRYTFTITPQVDDFVSRNQNIPDGWFVLRMVLTLPYQESLDATRTPTPEERFITAANPKIVRFTKGTIKTPVEFEFEDVSTLGRLSVLYIQITPVTLTGENLRTDGTLDERSTRLVVEEPNVKSLITAVNFLPLLDEGGSSNLPMPSSLNVTDDPVVADLDAFVARARRDTTDKPIMDAASYADKHRLMLANPESGLFETALNWRRRQISIGNGPLNVRAMHKLLEIAPGEHQSIPARFDDSVSRAICSAIALLQSPTIVAGLESPQGDGRFQWARECMRNPVEYLAFYKTVHALHIRPLSTKGVQASPMRYQIMGNFAANHGHSADISMSLNASLNTSLGAAALPAETMGALGRAVSVGSPTAGVGVSGSISQSDSYSVARTGISQTLSSLMVTPYKTNFHTSAFQPCLVVYPRGLKLSKNGKRGLYICGDKQKEIVLTEKYFYVYQDVYGEKSSSNQAVHIMIRGQRELARFFHLTERYVNPIKDHPEEVTKSVWARVASAFEKTNDMQPGVMTFPVYRDNQVQYLNDPPAIQKPGIWMRLSSIFKGTSVEGE